MQTQWTSFSHWSAADCGSSLEMSDSIKNTGAPLFSWLGWLIVVGFFLHRILERLGTILKNLFLHVKWKFWRHSKKHKYFLLWEAFARQSVRQPLICSWLGTFCFLFVLFTTSCFLVAFRSKVLICALFVLLMYSLELSRPSCGRKYQPSSVIFSAQKFCVCFFFFSSSCTLTTLVFLLCEILDQVVSRWAVNYAAITYLTCNWKSLWSVVFFCEFFFFFCCCLKTGLAHLCFLGSASLCNTVNVVVVGFQCCYKYLCPYFAVDPVCWFCSISRVQYVKMWIFCFAFSYSVNIFILFLFLFFWNISLLSF